MKKHNLDTKTDPPGTVTHYIEGDGMGVHHRTKITGGDARNLQEMTQFVDSIKKQYGSEESPSRNSVEWSIKRHIIISKKILKAAGLPDEPRKDGKRIDLEGLVLAKGFKKHSSPEWYAARILEDNDIVAANIGHEDAAWMGLHLGYLIREFENKLTHEKPWLIGRRKQGVQADLAKRKHEKYRAVNEAKYQKWQSAANAIWAKNMALSPIEVAKKIKQRLNLDVTARWIRENIEKPTA